MRSIHSKPFVCGVSRLGRTKHEQIIRLCSKRIFEIIFVEFSIGISYLWRIHSKNFSRAITPVIAVVVLSLMAVAAASAAYLTITTYQSESQDAGQQGIESVSTQTKTQLKIESVADGRIYLRNLGQEIFSNPVFYVEGKPLNVSGPAECESGKTCVYTVLENVSCSSECVLNMGEDLAVGTMVHVSEQELGSGGSTNPYCGDENCDLDENCLNCDADCGACTYFTLTTFSDYSSEENVTFSASGSNNDNVLRLPKNASVFNATLQVRGYYAPNLVYWTEIMDDDDSGNVWGVDIGDVDAAPGNEIVFSKYNNGQAVRIYYSNLTYAWEISVTSPRGVAVGEFNSSSSGNEIIVSSYSQNKVQVYSSSGTLIDEISVTYPQGLDIGDVDVSAGNELIVADPICEGPLPTICPNSGEDKVLVFSANKVNLWNLTGFSCPSDVVIGEFNSSSSGNEIAVADYGNNKTKIFSNTGLILGEIDVIQPLSVEIADVNSSSSGNELIISNNTEVDPDGTLFFYDSNLNLINQKFLWPDRPIGIAVGEISTNYPGNEIVLGNYGEGCVYHNSFYKTHLYCSSPSIDIGSDTDNQWSYTGNFNETETVPQFNDELNSFLPDCSCTGCTLVGDYCDIELKINSGSAGIIEITNIFVNYTQI